MLQSLYAFVPFPSIFLLVCFLSNSTLVSMLLLFTISSSVARRANLITYFLKSVLVPCSSELPSPHIGLPSRSGLQCCKDKLACLLIHKLMFGYHSKFVFYSKTLMYLHFQNKIWMLLYFYYWPICIYF